MIGPPSSPTPILRALLSAVHDGLAACERRPVETKFVAAGSVAWDDCCGQLVVAPERIYRSSEFPVEDTSMEQCFAGIIAINVVVLLVRCVPTSDGQAHPPTGDELDAAYGELLDDAGVVWSVLDGPLPDGWERANLSQTFVGDQGACVGVETRVTIGVDQSRWCLDCPQPPIEGID